MQKALSLMILGILTACSSPKKENTKVNSESVSNANIQMAALTGKWVQPIPGQKNGKQGIEFHANGVATSINRHTLLYEQWEVSHDTLFLWYHTEGIRQVSSDIDTLLIKKLDHQSLVVLSLAGDSTSNIEEIYHKEN
ncbi:MULTISPECIES: lipocalin family protein [unclassified Chryseobacterium]|uniref:lipocalin family protein n=1 Tax=unclassified Chryseobacterium TaxID=2593645 RepID=UPI000E0A4D95|nr:MULTISPECIES: lipocalin family protein [unclassified Chryseobacterium]MDQ1856027.1 lipocalin family protein [Chryseobacterium sp. WLY505]